MLQRRQGVEGSLARQKLFEPELRRGACARVVCHKSIDTKLLYAVHTLKQATTPWTWLNRVLLCCRVLHVCVAGEPSNPLAPGRQGMAIRRESKREDRAEVLSR